MMSFRIQLNKTMSLLNNSPQEIDITNPEVMLTAFLSLDQCSTLLFNLDSPCIAHTLRIDGTCAYSCFRKHDQSWLPCQITDWHPLGEVS
jgi:hypothetical protein